MARRVDLGRAGAVAAFCAAVVAAIGACSGDLGEGGSEDVGSGGAAGGGGEGASAPGGSGGTGASATTSTGSGAGGAGQGAGGSETTTTTSSTSTSTSTGTTGPAVEPPFGGSSKGSGGPAPLQGDVQKAGNVTYRLIVPGSPAKPSPLLLVYSGTEGGAQMAQNLLGVGAATGTSQLIRAVLDGVDYYGDAAAGAGVLDDVRAKYDIDNDRTYLLGESAGTSAALELGFVLRQPYFAAYWANDINATGSPAKAAAELGFAPWGQVGPGGQQAKAEQIVAAMDAAGYRLPNPTPYAGPGAGQHGSTQQFLAAVSWFPGKTRDE